MQFPIPEHLKKRVNDYVSYTAIDASGSREERDGICYANHMTKLSAYEFILLPRRDCKDWRDYFIDNQTYLRFVEVWKRHHIISEKTEAYLDKDVPMMRVPRGTSRHRAYAALCAYRWAESNAPLAWLMLKLYDDMPQTSIWQIIHYVMALHVYSTGHNWCNLAITNVSGGYHYVNTGQSFNMALSLAFPILWYKPEEELVLAGCGAYDTTCGAVQSIANEIGPAIAKSGISVPTLLVNGKTDQCDILSPKWTPLYMMAGCHAVGNNKHTVLKAQLLELHKEIEKTRPECLELRKKMEVPQKKIGGCGYAEW